jgi:hypothetical protein
MKILIGITGILIVFLPHLTFGSDSEVILKDSFGIQSLNESKLSDSDLSNIVGRGIEVSLRDGIDGNNAKIILWDEAQSATVMRDISTGFGNIQKSVISIQGR